MPAVASCLPRAELVEFRDDGVQRGSLRSSLGPFKASFEGEATIKTDPETRSGHIGVRGVDKRGGSHSRMTLDYRFNERAGATRVDIDVDLTLSGPIAQFGRTGLVTETANVLIADFARNLEDRISTSCPDWGQCGAASETNKCARCSSGSSPDQDQNPLRSPDLIGVTEFLRSGGVSVRQNVSSWRLPRRVCNSDTSRARSAKGGVASASGGRT